MDDTTSTIELRFEINLQKFSAIAVTVRLWEHEEIRREIRKYFDWQNNVARCNPQQASWRTLERKVFDHANLLNLSEQLLTLVRNVIVPIGERIFYWTQYLRCTLSMNIEYASKIYWTPLGTIDENECFQKHWVKVAENGHRIRGYLHLYFLGYLILEKNFLQAHFHKLKALTQTFLAPSKILDDKCKLHEIIVIWLCIHFKKTKAEATELYEELRQSDSPDKDLFLMCVNNSLLEATKYFWKRLNQSEKQSLIMEAAEQSVQYIENEYSKEKSIEICMFLTNNMTDKQKYDFCNDNFVRLINVFTSAWPYAELAEKIFKEFIYDNARLGKDYAFIREHFLQLIIDNDPRGRFVDKDLCRRIFREEWESEIKEFKVLEVINDDYYLSKLYEKFDISILNLIVNDEELSVYKKKMLGIGNSKFKQLIRSKDFELLNTFIQGVFDSESERKDFKLQISPFSDILSEGNYGLAEEILNWLSDGSAEERSMIKKQIDTKLVCSLFRNFKCELIDQLLAWQFDTEDEKKSAKDAMKENEFICDKIVTIWNENIEDAENKCMVFLKWLSGSEEGAVELKKRLIINENAIKKFCGTVPAWKHFQRINKLFQFFSVTPRKILEIKRNIVRHSGKLIETLLVDQKNFKVAEAVVCWIFSDHGQKKEAIENFINSLKGAELILKTYMRCKFGHVEPLLYLLNFWVRLYGRLDQIKENIFLVDVDGNSNFIIGWTRLITLLDLVEAGEKISKHQMNRFFPKDDSD